MDKRLTTGLATALAFAGCLLFSTTVPAGQSPAWEQIFLNGPIEVTLADGTVRTVDPSCSGGPVMTQTGLVAGDTQYSFFIQRRNPNKLIVVFDGGGACWNEATCIGSVLAGAPTYAPVVDETPESLAAGRGLLDVTNPENPFKEYTKVFVPYCTADVHWGSRDTDYEYELPFPPGDSLKWTIYHRGSENLIAVLDWLQRNGRSRQIDLGRVHDLTVAGLSAGAYGTLNGFAFFAQATPRARHNLIADAGIGVLTEPFYTRALYNADDESSESWGVSKNLPTWVSGFDTMLADAAADPLLLVPLAFQALAQWQPEAHFASLTAQLDATQIFFYSAMKNFTPGPQEAVEWWYKGMNLITSMAAAEPNYRYFIEAGTFHTFLANDARTYDVGANGISVADWIWEMIKPGNRTWENLEAPSPF